MRPVSTPHSRIKGISVNEFSLPFSLEQIAGSFRRRGPRAFDAGRAADILISECYSFDGKPNFHLNYNTLISNLQRLEAKRILLTHMGEDMLARLDQLIIDAAEDGQVIEL